MKLVFLLLFLTLSQNCFAKTFSEICKNPTISHIDHIDWLKRHFDTKNCAIIERSISKYRSLAEIIIPSEAINPKIKQSWTRHFPYMYGLANRAALLSFPNLKFDPFSSSKSLEIYKEFKNIRHITYAPNYLYTKNYSVCETLMNFPYLEEISIQWKELDNSENDYCIYKRGIKVILRGEFQGFIKTPKSKIIGIEEYQDHFDKLIYFPELQYLGVTHYKDELGTLKSLAEKVNLTHLSINLNTLEDPERISRLINLTHLSLTCDQYFSESKELNGCANGKLKNISFITKLKWLQFLDLSNNEIEDIKGISKLLYLEELILDNNQVTQFPNLEELKHLKNISISKNRLNSIYNAPSLPRLKFLNLSNNHIKDFTPLSLLKDLEFLNISDNPLISGDLNFLPQSLVGLNMSGGSEKESRESPQLSMILGSSASTSKDPIRTIEFLGSNYSNFNFNPVINDNTNFPQLDNLEVLIINNNALSKLPPLEKLRALKILKAENNLISWMYPLKSHSLEILDLSENKIKSFPDLSNFSNLNHIDLISNQISEVANLDKLKRPLRISLQKNDIESLPALRQASPAIKSFYELEENPLKKEDANCKNSANYTLRKACSH